MNIKVRDMALVALFAALTAVGAFIRIDIPYVPFTMQFFFCAFAAVLLGSKLGALSQVVYVAVGLMGIPVFTKGGGPGYIFQPTFGYLIGFIVGAYIIGKLIERFKRLSFWNVLMPVLAGLFTVYLLGVPYLYLIFKFYLNNPKSIGWVVFYGFAIFIGGDVLSSVIVSFAATRVIPILKKAGLIQSQTGNTA